MSGGRKGPEKAKIDRLNDSESVQCCRSGVSQIFSDETISSIACNVYTFYWIGA